VYHSHKQLYNLGKVSQNITVKKLERKYGLAKVGKKKRQHDEGIKSLRAIPNTASM